VGSSLTITVTPITATTSALPLTPGTATNTSLSSLVKIATLTAASTNSPNGLTVKVTSTGLLVSGSNSIALTHLGEAPGLDPQCPSKRFFTCSGFNGSRKSGFSRK